ncbi:Sphingoid long-chain base transporter RSB1 [Cyphellophora attinorum]|uniref:Sphingoid long-chain base transporter RSB1 n=1 Tax=Cyphellophora attinorum TaxID=1664694 RepID=A0A0N1H2A4_9EURO|nr:Sphingoid long-chain base transporter RSB1 [Phialophora attinorum]KPI35282.1 Sphingoid long-chain base transporter RSB1 [Phialophora attinorum]
MPAHHIDTSNCTDITPACPVELTVYGYYPTISANAYAVAVFSLSLVVNLALGYRFRTWTYLIAMGLACATSIGGYAGRLAMHDNPWSSAFELQIILFGAEWSRIPPRWYTYTFISMDIFALVLQGAGGGIAATADDDDSLLDAGDNIMITGIALQVVTLAIFGCLVLDYVIRRVRANAPLSAKASQTFYDIKYRIFAVALIFIYLLIIIRCIYRIAEMAGGWRNSIMQDESLFIGLDTAMMTIATLLQSFVHPGLFFHAMVEGRAEEKARKSIEKAGRISDGEVSS